MTHQLSPLFSWRSAIAESGLPPFARLVALTVSLHMNERGGSAFPSLETLAGETGMDRRTVMRTLKLLRRSGYLAVERGGGRGRSNRYAASVPESYPQAAEKQGHTAPVFAKTGAEKTLNRGREDTLGRKEDVKACARAREADLVCPVAQCRLEFPTVRKRDEHVYVVHEGPLPGHYDNPAGEGGAPCSE